MRQARVGLRFGALSPAMRRKRSLLPLVRNRMQRRYYFKARPDGVVKILQSSGVRANRCSAERKSNFPKGRIRAKQQERHLRILQFADCLHQRLVLRDAPPASASVVAVTAVSPGQLAQRLLQLPPPLLRSLPRLAAGRFFSTRGLPPPPPLPRCSGERPWGGSGRERQAWAAQSRHGSRNAVRSGARQYIV